MSQDYWSSFTSGRLNRRRALAGTGAGVLGAAFLAACGGGSSDSKSTEETSASKDKSGLLAEPQDTSSKAKAGGTIKNFVAAVDAQRAWYRANGVTDNQLFVARVIPRGETDYSETDVLSYHVNPPSPDRIPNRGDAAWKAFVKLFQDNSELKNEYMTCMPKPSK